MNKKLIDKIEAIFIVTIMFLGTSIIIQVNAMPPDPGPAPDLIRLEYSFDQPVITPILINETLYHQVRVNDTAIAEDYSVPIIPIKPVNVLLPQCGELSSINVTCDGYTSLGIGYNVELGDLPESYNTSTAPPPPYFSAADPYPPVLHNDSGVQELHGYSILNFALYPVHYVAVTGEIYYYQNMSVTIATNLTGEISPNFRGLPEDEMMIEQYVDNSIKLDTYVSLPIHSYSPKVNPSDYYEYVIITSENFKNYNGPGNDDDFQDFIDYKNSIGTKTKIMTVEDIYNEPEYQWDGEWGDGAPEWLFNDEQAQIRNFIKEAYNGWGVKYVLLGGDVDTVPARKLWAPIPAGYLLLRGNRIASDLYYACLEGSYNSNHNFKWGQRYDGEGFLSDVDLHAEVYIGRACISNIDELSNFIKKTLKYWKTTDNYIDKSLLVGEDFNHKNTECWGGDFMDELIDGCSANDYTTVGIPSDYYDFDKLYDRDRPRPRPNKWPVEDIINLINSNYHIINHFGHAEWNYNMRMYNHHVINNLTNEKHCFIYSGGCMPGDFSEIRGDCIAEYFTVKSEYGAFAGIWNVHFGFHSIGDTDAVSQRFVRYFWHAIFGKGYDDGDSIYKEIGPANQYSKEKNFWRLYFPYTLEYLYRREFRICYYGITVFGDPQIYIKKPVEPDPEWISPDGYNDPVDAWDDEQLAYDRETFTKAGCTIENSGWTWTPFIELTLSTPINSDKIRFYAWYNEKHCNHIDIDVFYNNGWHGVYFNTFPGYSWLEVPFNEHTVEKARVRFFVNRWLFSPVTADLHEFQFYQV